MLATKKATWMKSCPLCGKRESESKEQFVGAFCPECFARNKTLFKVKTPLSLDLCGKCGRIRIAGEWLRPEGERIAEFIASKTKSPYEIAISECNHDLRKNAVLVNAVFKVELPQGTVVNVRSAQRIGLEATLCEDCAKRSGGYYEAIIQLRGDKEMVARKAAAIESMVKIESFVTKAEQLREGLDVYIGSAQAARKALEKLGLAYTQATKLAGVKNGKRLYRRSYCVRL